MTSDAGDTRIEEGGADREGIGTFKLFVVLLFAFIVVRGLLLRSVVIPSGSMEPNLLAGDHVVVSTSAYGYSRYAIPFGLDLFQGRLWFRAPRRGDIVLFKLPRDDNVDYVKRLIGLPGDRIQIRRGLIYINDKPIQRVLAKPGVEDLGYGQLKPVTRYAETLPNGRRYLTNSYGDGGQADNTGVYVAPPHCYFVLGDNRDNSADSRFDPSLPPGATATCPWDAALDKAVSGEGVGFVPEENLEGRALMVLFSLKPGTLDSRPDRFARVLR